MFKHTKAQVPASISDPLRTFDDSVFAGTAGAAAASVCVCLAGGVFGALSVFTVTVRYAVVVTVTLWLAVGLTVSLQPVLRVMDILMGISHSCSAQVFIIIAVLLALLVGNVHMVLPACHLGISKISDWQSLLMLPCRYQRGLDGNVVPRWS